MNKQDINKEIIELLCMTQEQAFNEVLKVAGRLDNVVRSNKYVVIKDNKPKPMICVHLDTINTARGNEVFTANNFVAKDGYVKLTPESTLTCLGADDRAGLWVALKLIADGYASDYHFGFFCDEEIGGVGSDCYRKDFDTSYEDNVTCFIGLDRMGVDEVATYGSDNQKLIELFTNTGYKTALGSFTDASNLAYKKACVNLSVGYYNEHTPKESLLIKGMVGAYKTLTSDVILDGLCDTEYTIEAWAAMWCDNYSYEGYDDQDKIEAYEYFLMAMGYDLQEIVDDYHKTYN
jgi:hypothetical protein